MKKISFYALALMANLALTFFAKGQDCSYCNAALIKDARDEFETRTSAKYDEATNELFSHDYQFWKNYHSSSNGSTSLEGAYSIYSASFANSSANSEAEQKFVLMKTNYQLNHSISHDEQQYISQKVASKTAYDAWTKCVLNCDKKGIIFEKEGSSENDFIIALNWIPENSTINGATITNIIGTNCQFQEGDLKNNAKITPFNSLLRRVTRLDKYQDVNISVNVSGFGLKQISIAKGEALIANSPNVPIGSIVTTVFDYSAFTALNGEPTFFSAKSRWAPADGRNVEGSAYAVYSKTVPDLRGLFLRGRNQFYLNDAGVAPVSANQADPDGIRNAGADVQKDQISRHDHGLNGQSSPGYAPSLTGGNLSPGRSDNIAGDGGKPEGSTGYAGGSETRPKNISVYYYIRIN